MKNANNFDIQTSDDQNKYVNNMLLDYEIPTPYDQTMHSYSLNPFLENQTIDMNPSYNNLAPSSNQSTTSTNQLTTYDLNPSVYDRTHSYSVNPFLENQMIDLNPSHDDFTPFSNQSTTSVNQLIAYDSNPSLLNFNIDDNIEHLLNFIELPLGYRFMPTDVELVVGYLKRMVNNEPLPPNRIYNVNVYDHSPEELVGISGQNENNDMYFYSPYKRKSRGSTRADRITPNGFWKATCGDQPVSYNGEAIGNRKTLVYYHGKSHTAVKSHWIMHEYRLTNIVSPQQNNTDDTMVVCRIHKHVRGNRSMNMLRDYKMPIEHVFNVANDEYLVNLPLGFRFMPTDVELVVGYLKKIVNNEPLPANTIYNINVYDHSPDELVGTLGQNEDEDTYFFSPYRRKSRGGTRTRLSPYESKSRADRTTPSGYWKATNGDKQVSYNGEHVGNKKTLVYYLGKSPVATKTQWIMHEYRLIDTVNSQQNDENDTIIVCRIHKHRRGNRSNNDAA